MKIESNEHFIEIIGLLIEDLNQSNHDDVAKLISNGMSGFTGLTESWFELLDALELAEAKCDEGVAKVHVDLLQALIRAVKTILAHI